MASRKTLLIAVAMAIVVAVAASLPASASASAATYVVGGAGGWALGVNYSAWLSGTTFHVGDTLVFDFTAGVHDVVPVDALSYADRATPANAPALTSGNDLVVLEQPGQLFFISSVQGDCDSGMKLAITVG